MKYGCNMTAAQAIKELESIKYGLDRNAPKGSVAELEDRVAREAGLDFAIDVLKERIESPRPDWTPCADGLPKNTARYKVTLQVGGEVGTWRETAIIPYRYCDGVGEWILPKSDWLIYGVIAWTKADEPYNPDRKED